MTEVLVVEGLCKAFGGIVVADGIDLVLGEGRVLGLIGPNGAGKTSLFNLVCGVVKPDAGRIALAGERFDETRVVVSHRPRHPRRLSSPLRTQLLTVPSGDFSAVATSSCESPFM